MFILSMELHSRERAYIPKQVYTSAIRLALYPIKYLPTTPKPANPTSTFSCPNKNIKLISTTIMHSTAYTVFLKITVPNRNNKLRITIVKYKPERDSTAEYSSAE